MKVKGPWKEDQDPQKETGLLMKVKGLLMKVNGPWKEDHGLRKRIKDL